VGGSVYSLEIKHQSFGTPIHHPETKSHGSTKFQHITLTTFLNLDVINHKLVSVRQTVNSAFHIKVLRHLMAAIQQKRQK
jgi:hypothetical protein